MRESGDKTVAAGACEAEGLRLQKGMPDGFWREDDSFLPEDSKLDSDLPGLVGRPWCPSVRLVALAVLALLWESVRFLPPIW